MHPKVLTDIKSPNIIYLGQGINNGLNLLEFSLTYVRANISMTWKHFFYPSNPLNGIQLLLNLGFTLAKSGFPFY